MPAKKYKEDRKVSVDKSLRKDWIEALESGKYSLGKDCLRRGNCYCPLGVLADIVAKKYPNKVRVTQNDGVYAYDGSSFVLPSSVVALAGLHDAGGGFMDKQRRNRLTETVELSISNVWDSGMYTISEIVKILKNPQSHVFVDA